MQCVIIAAGEGVRMRPLTLERPKPLIPVLGKPIIEHILDALPSEIDEVVIVIGYLGELIQQHLGERWKDIPLHYVTQKERLGTADALMTAREQLHGKFLLMNADDIHGAAGLHEAVQHDLALVVSESEHPERFGVVSQNTDGTLAAIVEKPAHPSTNLVNTGTMVLDERIFSYMPERSASGEFYLTDMITALAQVAPVAVVRQSVWLPVGYPDDIAKVEEVLRNV